ncbi:MAG TPA: Fur family transcriptional regulator [Acidimicrobiales bacterium]|nr:Fur family transcriptional regulator [Acidimicrobiales bacterium]
MHSPEELTTLFRHRGRKVTPQRQCIFRILHQNPTHPTAESVYATAVAEMPTISLKTVYQTLNDLAEMGEISVLDLGTGATRFDPDTGGHHHLVCTSCGAVRDLFADYSGVVVPAGLEQGFEVGEAEVVFRGLCETCRAGSPAAAAGARRKGAGALLPPAGVEPTN